MEPEFIAPDPELTSEQEALVRKLKKEDVVKIDKALISNASEKWRKIARIVAVTMNESLKHYPQIPDIYYAKRIRLLVKTGSLEAQGYTENMRYGEVRIPR
ncbi:MAG: DUF3658 domain-containing protein [Candidatus Thiodiazotropha sp. (ex Codakia rugifera)]|nr:DUF3658 domain-containing protein [Candidatus Thiodiazotropha sp. (ex Codakia rugifera)]